MLDAGPVWYAKPGHFGKNRLLRNISQGGVAAGKAISRMSVDRAVRFPLGIVQLEEHVRQVVEVVFVPNADSLESADRKILTVLLQLRRSG